MFDIISAANELAEQLHESSIYNEYTSAKELLSAQPERLALLARYQRQVQLLAEAEAEGNEDLLELKRGVSAAFFAMTAHPDLLRFLDAERAAVALVSDVLEIVASRAVIDIGGAAV